ncbi:iron export ABC transporter permease subunit FetB [Microbulbifer sp. OS29]|uniref:Iron export ABC transporter permease subunit FetB n=1 Tax=Microbulbifer okhotskensis TaxID=2926617 RepID=A0A9X2ELV0_9GAMM|nr:iron export ABC transporter permease subunit FetB [Microbulbifer okhotskensis]MCO1334612.1 iron export ABC transporter permease subunit FetB [Microbulbifer okhotskensis]
MNVIDLSWWQLSLAAGLVLALAVCTHIARLQLGKSLIIAAVRTVIQLTLIGLVLDSLFAVGSLLWVSLLALAMLLFAGQQVASRQKYRLRGGWSFAVGTLSMLVSAFCITLLCLVVLIAPEPWYQPQYSIPLLGMLLGNTMTGVALSLDRLTESMQRSRDIIENRLMLGQPWQQACLEFRRDAMRAGLMPTINAMAAAGIVFLPGMMTGQILSGTSPTIAVKYQILILFAIASGTGFGTFIAVTLASRKLFDKRERLRTDRLIKSKSH